MRIAMAQISSGTDPEANLATVGQAAAVAATGGAALVVFPEATMCRFGVPLGPVAQPLDGPWAQAVSEIAAARQITVIAGMFTPAADGRVRNTLLLARPDGTRIGYHKIHLYDAFGFRESDTVAAGDAAVVVDVDGVGVGLTTCYDIRFPALFTALAARGAQVIVTAASWGAGPGKVAQWQTLATARALDATAFVVALGQAEPTDAAARTGRAPTGIGHSQISDPFGSVVASYEQHAHVGIHDLDVARVATAREQLAVLANQRDFRILTDPTTPEDLHA
ncbi:MAG: carbon-nitrogen hydrolase family protein [Gordonia sp. (in: high G+C Gram-positive bacteria)]